jgi:hypothetical protein
MRLRLLIPLGLVLTACENQPDLGKSGSTSTGPLTEADTGDTAIPTTSGSSETDTGDSDTDAPDPTTGGPVEDQGGWSIRDADPYGRAGHAVVLDEKNDRLIVFGGGANDTWQLPLAGPGADVWSQLIVAGEHPPVHAYGGSMFADSAVYDPARERMIVLVNPTPVTASTNAEVELWQLSLAGTPQWQRITTAGPDPGAEVQTGRVVLDRDGDRLFVVGGALDKTGVWTLSLADTPTWERFADTPPDQQGPFYLDTSLLLDAERGQLVMFGGWPRLQKIWGLSLATREWTLLDDGELASGSYGATATLDAASDRIVIFGGDQTSKVHLFSLATHTWTATSAGEPGAWPIGASGAVDAQRGRVLYFGGLTATDVWEQEAVNTTWSLSLADLTLAELIPATHRADLGMGDRTAVWDEARQAVVAFGGQPDGETWSHGLAATDTWTGVDVGGSTPSLIGMSGIYDPVGAAIVAFGGTLYTDSDVALRLASSPGAVWEPIVAEAPPAARSHHVAVYDPVNRRMVVHGGQINTNHGATFLDDTWTLALDGAPVWTELSPSGSQPAARAGHVAIHDPEGQRMIFYGGKGPWGEPLTDVWSLSLVGAPAWTRIMAGGERPGDSRHAAAVHDPDGRRMIVVDLTPGLDSTPARVFALELDGPPEWHRFCSPGLTPAEVWSGSGTATNTILVDDGLFVTVSGGAFRFDLETEYCD